MMMRRSLMSNYSWSDLNEATQHSKNEKEEDETPVRRSVAKVIFIYSCN